MEPPVIIVRGGNPTKRTRENLKRISGGVQLYESVMEISTVIFGCQSYFSGISTAQIWCRLSVNLLLSNNTEANILTRVVKKKDVIIVNCSS